MKKNAAAHCPYCGNMINYFYLYDAKRSDFGYCSHCGGIYAVKYSPLAYLLIIAAAGAMLGSFAFWYLANKTLPGPGYLLICAAVITALYFLLPLLITPRRVIVRGRLGGFPSVEYIPVHRKDRNRPSRKLVVGHRPEVLHPHKKNTDSTKQADSTKGRKSGVFRQEKARRLRLQTVRKPAEAAPETNTSSKK
ncbi:MAG: prepilin peptidase [Clostridia bacterium]|nr:prepilin peptidase [Clostridia bacterium]